MQILSTIPIAGVSVITDEDEYNRYTRYGPDCWFVAMDDVLEEPVYVREEVEELEELYQKFINNKRI